jgi:hypothetical protein
MIQLEVQGVTVHRFSDIGAYAPGAIAPTNKRAWACKLPQSDAALPLAEEKVGEGKTGAFVWSEADRVSKESSIFADFWERLHPAGIVHFLANVGFRSDVDGEKKEWDRLAARACKTRDSVAESQAARMSGRRPTTNVKLENAKRERPGSIPFITSPATSANLKRKGVGELPKGYEEKRQKVMAKKAEMEAEADKPVSYAAVARVMGISSSTMSRMTCNDPAKYFARNRERDRRPGFILGRSSTIPKSASPEMTRRVKIPCETCGMQIQRRNMAGHVRNQHGIVCNKEEVLKRISQGLKRESQKRRALGFSRPAAPSDEEDEPSESEVTASEDSDSEHSRSEGEEDGVVPETEDEEEEVPSFVRR